MPQFDLAENKWVEVVAAGSSSPQQINISMGEALVSVGAPTALTSAIKLGGAARSSLEAARSLNVDAGYSVWVRPIGLRVLFYVGQAAGGSPTPTPTPTPTAAITAGQIAALLL